MSGRSRRVKWEKFTDELGAWISEKREEVEAGIDTAVLKTAKKAVESLKDTDDYLYTDHGVRKKARRFKGVMRQPGTYKRNFAQKKMEKLSKSKSDFRRIVYVKSPEYRLTHLLEHGHRIVTKKGATGRRTRKIIHFAPVEDQAAKDLKNYMQREIKTSLGSPL